MQLALKRRLAQARISLSILLAGLISGPVVAPRVSWADSAYIQQAGGATTINIPAYQPISNAETNNSAHFGTPGAFAPTPELNVPRSHNGNYAQSLTIGSYNNVAQIQAGKNDTSSVAVVGGKQDNVGVLQTGNNVLSNIVLIGMQGTSVGVLQSQNATPVNMLIARLPNGSILIRK